MLQIETNTMHVAIGAWFSVAISLWYMLFDFFADDFTLDGADDLLPFGVARVFERGVL